MFSVSGGKLTEKTFPFSTLIATTIESLSDKVLEDIAGRTP
jgi:hypothetical protein